MLMLCYSRHSTILESSCSRARPVTLCRVPPVTRAPPILLTSMSSPGIVSSFPLELLGSLFMNQVQRGASSRAMSPSVGAQQFHCVLLVLHLHCAWACRFTCVADGVAGLQAAKGAGCCCSRAGDRAAAQVLKHKNTLNIMRYNSSEATRSGPSPQLSSNTWRIAGSSPPPPPPPHAHQPQARVAVQR